MKIFSGKKISFFPIPLRAIVSGHTERCARSSHKRLNRLRRGRRPLLALLSEKSLLECANEHLDLTPRIHVPIPLNCVVVAIHLDVTLNYIPPKAPKDLNHTLGKVLERKAVGREGIEEENLLPQRVLRKFICGH